MIVRIWTADAIGENANEYRKHFNETMLPRLHAIKGFVNAELLERVVGHRIELVVLTRWDSLDAIRAFAGSAHERAVVEPEARSVLDRFDEMVKHYVVAVEVER